jgi:hypothetical protein
MFAAISRAILELAALRNQASSGRWMSLKLRTFFASGPSMIFRQTTHVLASSPLLGTNEGVSE